MRKPINKMRFLKFLKKGETDQKYENIFNPFPCSGVSMPPKWLHTHYTLTHFNIRSPISLTRVYIFHLKLFTRNISYKPMSEDDYTPPPPIVFGNLAGLTTITRAGNFCWYFQMLDLNIHSGTYNLSIKSFISGFPSLSNAPYNPWLGTIILRDIE